VNITTNFKGQIAMSKAELRALELGYIPSRPLYDTRYDLLIDDFQKILRVQVKYADGKTLKSSGAVRVKLDYETRTRKVYTYQLNEVDALIVYIPKIDRLVYLPPEKFVGKRALNIRIEKSKNNQQSKILFAEDYFW
jgi:hypothetical protein